VRRKLSADQYAKMLEAYRLKPGVYGHAARHAGCARKTAKRCWESGAAHHDPAWSEPIKTIIEREQRNARAAATPPAPAPAARKTDQEVQLEHEAEAEAATVATGRSLTDLWRRVYPYAVQLADRVRVMAMAPEQQVTDPAKGLALLNALGRLADRACKVNITAAELVKLRSGRPTVIRMEHVDMSVEDAEKELRAALSALEDQKQTEAVAAGAPPRPIDASTRGAPIFAPPTPPAGGLSRDVRTGHFTCPTCPDVPLVPHGGGDSEKMLACMKCGVIRRSRDDFATYEELPPSNVIQMAAR
jgi:hypothetical protein